MSEKLDMEYHTDQIARYRSILSSRTAADHLDLPEEVKKMLAQQEADIYMDKIAYHQEQLEYWTAVNGTGNDEGSVFAMQAAMQEVDPTCTIRTPAVSLDDRTDSNRDEMAQMRANINKRLAEIDKATAEIKETLARTEDVEKESKMKTLGAAIELRDAEIATLKSNICDLEAAKSGMERKLKESSARCKEMGEFIEKGFEVTEDVEARCKGQVALMKKLLKMKDEELTDKDKEIKDLEDVIKSMDVAKEMTEVGKK